MKTVGNDAQVNCFVELGLLVWDMRCDAMRRAAAAVSGADKEIVRKLPMQRLRMEVLEGLKEWRNFRTG